MNATEHAQLVKDAASLRDLVQHFDQILYGMQCAYEQLQAQQGALVSAYNQHVAQVEQFLRGIAARLLEMDDRLTRLEHGGEWHDA